MKWVKANERLPDRFYKSRYTEVLIRGRHLNVKVGSQPAYGNFFQIGSLIKFEYQYGYDSNGGSGCVLEDEFDRISWLDESPSTEPNEFLLYLDKEAEWNLHLYKSHSLDPIAKARYDLLAEIKEKYLSIINNKENGTKIL